MLKIVNIIAANKQVKPLLCLSTAIPYCRSIVKAACQRAAEASHNFHNYSSKIEEIDLKVQCPRFRALGSI